MIDEDVAEYIEALDIGYSRPPTLPRNLLTGILPDQPAACCAVVPTGGASPERNQETGRIEEGRVVVWIRDPSYATARSRAYQIYQAMASFANTVIGSNLYLALVPLQMPFMLERDASDRTIMAMNVRCLRAA